MTGGLALHLDVEPAEVEADSARARLRAELAVLIDERNKRSPIAGHATGSSAASSVRTGSLHRMPSFRFQEKVRHQPRTPRGIGDTGPPKLPADTILLEFACVLTATRGHVLEGGDIWVFCLSRDSLEVRKTNLSGERVALLSEAFAQECQGIFPTDALDVLGRELLDSVGESLANSKSLLIVASVGLHGVPFHAMQFRGNRLVESHAVSYLPREHLARISDDGASGLG